jgi:REase_AHJR-like/Protein of unknown function DUF86
MAQLIEREVLSNALADLREQGFEVFLEPSGRLLPAFLRELKPDAIATKGNKGIVVDVEWSPSRGPSKVSKFRNALSQHEEWELRVLLLNATDPQADLPQQTIDRLNTTLLEINHLKDNGFNTPAVLLGWATFEALGRSLLEGQLTKPQSPVRVVDQLAKEGFLTPDEADSLRSLAKKRNRLIHGDLGIEVSETEITFFVELLSLLALEVAKAPLHP